MDMNDWQVRQYQEIASDAILQMEKERKLRNELETEIVFYKERLAIKDNTIRHLLDEISELRGNAGRTTYFVVCKDYNEFREYMRDKSIDSSRDRYRYVNASSVDTLRGTQNPNIVWYGNWIQNPNITSIIEQIRMATR